MQMQPEDSTEAAATTLHLRRPVVRELSVGGFVPLSSTDFPGQLAAVVFCQGCPWRCGYCHNPHLQPPRSDGQIRWSVLREALSRRRGLLDTVVFSGGEPTAQTALRRAMEEVRGMGFRVGLHTAGIYPRRLERLLPMADWIGFDVKAEFADYETVTGVRGSGVPAIESLGMVIGSGIDCEVRTTAHPRLMSPPAMMRLAAALARLGVKRYVVQEFRAQGCADRGLREQRSAGYPDEDLFRDIARLVETFEIRRA